MKHQDKSLTLGPHLTRSYSPPESSSCSYSFAKALPGFLAALALLLLAPSCSDTVADPDGGPAADLMRSERILPPDGLSTEDAGWNGNVGAPCTTDGQCTGQAECLVVNGVVGICSLTFCTMEDINTPEQEDNCPTLDSGVATVCTEVPVSDEQDGTTTVSHCLPKCTPLPDRNPCAEMGFEGLACDPLSLLLNGHSEVCLFPACKTQEDCGNKNPANPNALCIKETGTCQIRGKDEVLVGSPCTISTDCGPAQFCFAEFTESGQLFAEGGYCTKIGCVFGGPWSCPEESKCFSMANAMSLCLVTGCKSNEPLEANGCRDQASPGQYSCIKLGEDEVCWLDLASK